LEESKWIGADYYDNSLEGTKNPSEVNLKG